MIDSKDVDMKMAFTIVQQLKEIAVWRNMHCDIHDCGTSGS